MARNRRCTVKARKLLAALVFGPGLTVVLVALLDARDGTTPAAQVSTPTWATERVWMPPRRSRT